MRFSANLGFLFTGESLPDAIRSAARHGFDAVECHWPFEEDPAAIVAALNETGLPMLSLNTSRGDVSAGDNGLAAIPGREAQARTAIDAAIDYACSIGCRNVHVMAGKAEGPGAFSAFTSNLAYAAERADLAGIGLLIEPLNTRDAPGYFLTSLDVARAVVGEVGVPNLRIMFDCYHMQIMGGDLLDRISRNLDHIGHIQFAGVPGRDEPDRGEVAYERLFVAVQELGFSGYFGAEYRPTSGSFKWLGALRHSIDNNPIPGR